MSESSQGRNGNGLAIAGLVLGIISICASMWWFFGIILGVLAVVFGSVSLKTPTRSIARAGIVTGIVGLALSIIIAVVVSWVLSALQLAQRDTARKSDVANIASVITSYQSDNKGQLPDSTDISVPQLWRVTSIVESGSPTTETAIYKKGTDCSGNVTLPRSYSISVLLENGAEYCQDF